MILETPRNELIVGGVLFPAGWPEVLPLGPESISLVTIKMLARLCKFKPNGMISP